MKKKLLTAAIFLSNTILLSAQPDPKYDSLIKKLASDFETPGVAVAVMSGSEFKEYVFGFSNIEAREKISRNTIFNVASISKLITGIAVLQLAEEGRIELDKPIETYLKNWKLPGEQYSSDEVTIRRVLNHSAGLSGEFGPGFSPQDSLLSLADILSGKSTKRKALTIEFNPGSQHSYSNPGFGLLQMMIEDVSGMSFNDYMKKNIFEKINMTGSGFVDPLSLTNKNNLATPYDYRMTPLNQERFVVLAAAGLLTTLSDMEKMMLEETQQNKILKKSAYNQMWGNNDGSIYGLAHTIQKYKAEPALVGHTGLGMGWNSSYQFIPGTDKGIIILTNGDNGFYIHNMLTGYWYFSVTGKTLESCKAAPEKKLNRIEFYIEFSAEEGMLAKSEAESDLKILMEVRNDLKESNFTGLKEKLAELEKNLISSIKNENRKTEIKEAIRSCFYWIDMPWFNKQE